MLLRNFGALPNYAPETGAGGGSILEGDASRQAPPQEQREDGPGSGRTPLRKTIETSFREAERQEAKDTKDAKGKERKEERSKDGKYVSQKRQQEASEEGEGEVEVEEQAEGQEQQEGQQQEAEGEVEAEGQEQQAAEAPKGWSKEAKAEWANLSPLVQAAISKREGDMEKGVASLKKNYAELDQVLQPRLELVKSHGHTPAQAVNQLFSWFEALGQDAARVKAGYAPVAFTALAQSFGLDPRSLAGQSQQQQPQSQEQEQQEQQEPDPYAERFGAIEQALNSLVGTFDYQRQSQTVDILSQWSKDKPYFGEVRQMMAHLLQSGAVPPLPGNRADLDKAYDMALYALPEVRTKVLEDQRKTEAAQRKAKEVAERKAESDRARSARQASVGLGPSSPGAEPPAQKGKRKTIRESLNDAMKELSE